MPFDEEKLLRGPFSSCSSSFLVLPHSLLCLVWLLTEHLDFITRDLGLKKVEIKLTNSEVALAGGQAAGAGVKPGQPTVNFFSTSS
jgi:hypothetical protein